MSDTVNTETVELNCLKYASQMKDENLKYILTGTTVGKYHYLLIGGQTTRNILFERIPCPIVTMGKFPVEALANLRLVVGYDDQDNALGATVMVDGKEVVDEEGVSEDSLRYSKMYLQAALSAKKLPITEDKLGFLQGLEGSGLIHVVADRTVQASISAGDEESTYAFGRGGQPIAEFSVPISTMRIVNLKSTASVGFAPLDDKLGFFVANLEDAGCGLFRVANAGTYKRLQTPSVKELVAGLKDTLGNFEELHKESMAEAKLELTRRDAAFKEFKKDILEEIKMLTQAAGNEDSGQTAALEKKIVTLENKNEDLTKENSELKSELKVFEKIRKAAQEIG